MIEVNAVHICRVPGIMESLLFSKAQHDLVSPRAKEQMHLYRAFL